MANPDNRASSSLTQTRALEQLAFAQRYNIWNTVDVTYVFYKIPQGTFWELPAELNQLRELKAECSYPCLDLEGEIHMWGLIQARGAWKKELLVYVGWQLFLANTGYVAGDTLMIGFSRRLQTFFLVPDGKHPL